MFPMETAQKTERQICIITASTAGSINQQSESKQRIRKKNH